jgi:hypothetical protein
MFAVDHAATALLLKRKYPTVPTVPLLLSVQAMELAWVALNYLGIERTTTEPVVRSVADIHLAYMPYSHCVAVVIGVALLFWLVIEKGMGKPLLGRAVALGIVSHLVLDFITHAPDLALWPAASAPKIGLGLYQNAPLVAFFLEIIYGVVCWYIYKGSRALLAFLVIGNIANLSFFSAAVPGPEQFLAGRPMLTVTLILFQIVIALLLVGFFARNRPHDQRLAPA